MKQTDFKSWLIWYLRQPFRMIVWFMETFAKNRATFKAFSGREKVASIIKTIMVVTFFGWLLVFAFLSTKEEGDRFGCAVKSLYSGFDQTGCDPQPWQQPK